MGFGLFAILSIVRLRSSAVTQQEVAYYFVALVLGLINGIRVPDRTLLVAMNVLLLGVMLVFDSRVLRDPPPPPGGQPQARHTVGRH